MTPGDAKDAPDTAGARFLCIGDLDVDVLIAVDRLPTQDGKVNGRLIQRVPGGMAANVAAAIAELGGKVSILGRVGQDAEGAFVLGALAQRGVNTNLVRRMRDAPTFSCISLVASNGEKSLIKLMTDAYCPAAEDLSASSFRGVTHAHLTSVRDPALCRQVVELSGDLAISCSLDVEMADLPAEPPHAAKALRGFDILFFNRASQAAAEALLGVNVMDLAPVVVITLGAEGARISWPGGSCHAPGYETDVQDTTGAGDCFAAGLLHARFAQGLPWPEALRFANAAAALSVKGLGAQSALPKLSAVQALLAQRRPGG